jgi:hypothetical protein
MGLRRWVMGRDRRRSSASVELQNGGFGEPCLEGWGGAGSRVVALSLCLLLPPGQSRRLPRSRHLPRRPTSRARVRAPRWSGRSWRRSARRTEGEGLVDLYFVVAGDQILAHSPPGSRSSTAVLPVDPVRIFRARLGATLHDGGVGRARARSHERCWSGSLIRLSPSRETRRLHI